jgi:hypothetical protein
MDINFYRCNDDPRVLTKTLGNPVYTATNVVVKNDLTLREPSLELAYNAAIETANYLTIGGKYYFIKPYGITRATGGRMLVQASLDLLTTYDTQIRQLPAISRRTESSEMQDWYLRDTQQPIRSYRHVVTIPGQTLTWSDKFVLITAG